MSSKVENLSVVSISILYWINVVLTTRWYTDMDGPISLKIINMDWCWLLDEPVDTGWYVLVQLVLETLAWSLPDGLFSCHFRVYWFDCYLNPWCPAHLLAFLFVIYLMRHTNFWYSQRTTNMHYCSSTCDAWQFFCSH